MSKSKLNEPIDYVEVADEPIHKEAFKNQYVRIYNVVIQPGEQTLYHRHCEDTVYTVIQGGAMGTQIAGSSKQYRMNFPKSFSLFSMSKLGIGKLFTGFAKMPEGLFFCMMHRKQPVIHKAYASTGNLKQMILMGVEIRERLDKNNTISFDNNYFKLDYKSDEFSIYRLKLNPKESTESYTYNFPMLAIILKGTCSIDIESMDEQEAQNISLIRGDFKWYDYKTTLKISNESDEDFEALFIALK